MSERLAVQRWRPIEPRPVLQALSLVWAAAGGAIAAGGFSDVTADARPLLFVISVLGPCAALAAASAFAIGRDRLAGLCLIAKAIVTPTYAAAALNLVPLVAGLAWLVRSVRSQRTR